jgi:hypothetical protein
MTRLTLIAWRVLHGVYRFEGPTMKRKSKKPHLLHARVGVITHQVSWFLGEAGDGWLTVACETDNLAVPPRHYHVPKHAKLTRQDVDCMACISLGASYAD